MNTRRHPARAAEESRSASTCWKVFDAERERRAEGQVMIGGSVGESRCEQDRVRPGSGRSATLCNCGDERRVRAGGEVRAVLFGRAYGDHGQCSGGKLANLLACELVPATNGAHLAVAASRTACSARLSADCG